MNEFEELISQPPNLDGSSFSQTFKSDISNIQKCQEYLKDESCSEKVQIFLTSAIWDFVQKSNKMQNLFQLDEQFSISQWCIDILNFQFLKKPAIKTIALIFGYIVYNLWSIDTDVIFQKITKLNSIPYCELNLMNETIIAFSQNYSISPDNSIKFSELLNKFNKIARNFIDQTDNKDVIEIALEVIFNCICYGDLSFFESITIQNDKLRAFNPKIRIESILSDNGICFFIDIYVQTQLSYALKILCCIISLKKSDFLEVSEDTYTFTSNIPAILDNFLNVESPDLVYITYLILTYSKKLIYKSLFEDDELNPLFMEITSNVFEFCTSIFNIDNFLREDLIVYSNLMSFWGTISNIIQKKDKINEPLINQISDITEIYISFLLSLVLSNDPELIYDVINDSLLVTPFKLLISSNVIDIFTPISNTFDQQFEPDEMQLAHALFMKLSTAMLEEDKKLPFDKIIEKKESIFSNSLIIIETSSRFLEANPERLSVNLELSILNFIKRFKFYYITDSIEIIIVLIQRVIISLQIFGNNDQISYEANEAFKEITTFCNDKIFQEIYSDLLQNFNEYPFFQVKEITDKRQLTNKVMFISSVYSIAYRYSVSNVIFDFLSILLENKDFANLITCSIGILNCKNDGVNQDNTIRLFFDWLLPDKISFFISHCESPNDLMLVLKFFQSLLKPCISQPFPKHSSNGILTFNAISDILMRSINIFTDLIKRDNDEDTNICYTISKRIAYISSLLLSKPYIMFDAYKIYKDPRVEIFINSIETFITNSDFQNVIDYPKLFIYYSSLMSSIICKHLDICSNSLFEQITFFYENLMLQHQISLYRNPNSKLIFDDGLYNLIHYVNCSRRSNIDEIKSIMSKCFRTAFCYLWEITINNNNCNYCYIIKELLLYDDSLLGLFKLNFEQNLNDSTDFQPLFEEFVENLPIITSPGALENDFKVFCEKFIRLKKEFQTFHFILPDE